MSWEQKLYETYEKNKKIDKVAGEEQAKLTPLSHITVKAQVEITLDNTGNFVNANIVNKEDCWTLIPVTDASAIRSSGMAPHPLCDNLSYVAGDFEKYGGTLKKDKASEKTGFDVYLEQLKKWASWTDAHEKVKAIYNYLNTKTVTADLIQSGILHVDKNGLLTNEKVNGQSVEKVFVRFKIIGENNEEERTWKDDSLIENYLNYIASYVKHDLRLDLLQGKILPTNPLHPKGILPGNYGAKLISSNDKSNYTYRGRFITPDQAANVGYETSQKIHAALTWLLKNQGVAIGSSGRYYLYWSPNPQTMPTIFGEEIIKGPTVQAQNKTVLANWLANKISSVPDDEEIMVIGLEAPSPGQLAIVEYKEYAAKNFFETIMHWQKTCNWYFWKSGAMTIHSPSLFQITNNVYGIERNGAFEVNDKLFRDAISRLQTCMLNKQPLPYDIVKTITDKASCLYKFSTRNRMNILSTACALIKKYNADHNKGEEKMILDHANHDRNYLFGRLLAVYERIETIATIQNGKERETNALKLQPAFVQHPGNVWKILEQQTNPYLTSLTGGARENFRKLITEIVSLFENQEDMRLNKSLNENYLLGYYLQRAEFYKKNVETDQSKGDQ